MKLITRIILYTITIAFAISGCKKDSDVFLPDPTLSQGPDTTWHNVIPNTAMVKLLKASLAPTAYLDSFEVNNNPVTIVSPDGLTCNFPPLCCIRPNGQAVTGKVYVQMQLIRKRGDMITVDKPTVSYDRLLVSGGEMFVGLFKNGEELLLAPNKMIVLKYNEPQTDTRMRLFFGDESNPDRFNWISGDTTALGIQNLTIGNNFYQLVSNSLRWINCDYFFDTTGINRVQIATSMPPNYTNGNTITYLVFNNLRSVLGMYGNASTKRFLSGLVPPGQSVTIVSISRSGSDYFLGKQSFVTGQNTIIANQQVVALTPLPSTLPDIKAYLATL